MPPVRLNKPPKCVACGGTGVSSRGGPCNPCVVAAAYERLRAIKDGRVPKEIVDASDLEVSDRV